MTSLHKPMVLIVDDEPGIRIALQTQFLRIGWQAEVAAGVRDAERQLAQIGFDLVICDMRVQDGDGFDVLRTAQGCGTPAAFLFLTAYGSVPDAVRAMQGGAIDYLTKPASFDRLQVVVDRVMLRRRSLHGNTPPMADSGIIGHSRALQLCLARAQAAASTDSDVLVEAESGTGKELLARLIHRNSPRRNGPFIAINCAALPESLLESELFGHARGAFTGATAAKPGKFELANGGTLMLDEIGDMPLSLQPKPLRALQERTVERLGETRPIHTDMRVIATTNVHLESVVQRGAFRSDLFYRLNVIPLSLPPLRERMEDVPLLAEHFARQFAHKHARTPARLSPEFLDRLASHQWPGNIRELGNFIQRVLSLHGPGDLSAADFDSEHRPSRLSLAGPIEVRSSNPSRSKETISMGELERSHLERTLELVEGNRTRAAEMLGLSVRTVRNKIRQYDLPPRRYA